MNSTIHAHHAGLAPAKSKALKVNASSDFWKFAEYNRFGIICVLLIVVACMGGLAAATAIQRSTLQLILVAIPVMTVESSILAVMSMRFICIASAISLLISSIIFLI